MGNHLFDLISARVAELDTHFVTADYERSYSYQAMLAGSARAANVLVSLGVKPGDRVAVQVGRSIEAMELYLGTIRAGAIFVPLDTAYNGAEIAQCLSDSKPRIFVCDPRRKDAVKPFAKMAGAKLQTLGVWQPWHRGTTRFFDKLLLAMPRFANVERASDDIAAMLYTSCTTGYFKGESVSHDKLWSDGLALVDQWSFTKGDVLLHALPNLHTDDLLAVTNATLLAGAKMILLPDYGKDAFFRYLPRVTSMIGGLDRYDQLLQDARLNKEATKHMRLFLSGAEPLPAGMLREWKDRTGHAIRQCRGLNELHMSMSKLRDGDQLSAAMMSAKMALSSRAAVVSV